VLPFHFALIGDDFGDSPLAKISSNGAAKSPLHTVFFVFFPEI
jgi:hypothetical protein